MKTKQYIDKYELHKTSKFNHDAFISDLGVEFDSLLLSTNGYNTMSSFTNGIRCIKQKFNAINNKIPNGIPSHIWYVFSRRYIIPKRDKHFPKQYLSDDLLSL